MTPSGADDFEFFTCLFCDVADVGREREEGVEDDAEDFRVFREREKGISSFERRRNRFRSHKKIKDTK